MMLLTKHSAKY